MCGAWLSLTSMNARAEILSGNMQAVSSGTEHATPENWLAASFGTGTSAHTLNAVTLLLANPSPGAAVLQLYSNGGLIPGTLMATLTSPGSYSATLAPATFTTPGVPLNANTTYWIVLRPQSGVFHWSWTADDSGSGVGFQHTWAVSPDTGLGWWSYDIYQTQMEVAADLPCTLSGDVNSDGRVDQADLGILLAHFQQAVPPDTQGDLNGDGMVDQADLGILLASFGTACP